LVKEAPEWPYSSFVDYPGTRNGNLCNKNRAAELLRLSDPEVRTIVPIDMCEELIEKIY
jgi:hypothetical protein